MLKKNLPMYYFGLFAAYLVYYNWNELPVAGLFLTGFAGVIFQIVRPNAQLYKFLFGLAVLFTLSYAGAIIRIMIETGDLTPFSPRANKLFFQNCLTAVLNGVAVFLWYWYGIKKDKTGAVAVLKG